MLVSSRSLTSHKSCQRAELSITIYLFRIDYTARIAQSARRSGNQARPQPKKHMSITLPAELKTPAQVASHLRSLSLFIDGTMKAIEGKTDGLDLYYLRNSREEIAKSLMLWSAVNVDFSDSSPALKDGGAR